MNTPRPDLDTVIASDMAGHSESTNDVLKRKILASSLSHTAKSPTATKSDLREVKEPVKILCSLVSGATAGAVAKTTIAPLDRTKIMFQVSDKPFSVQKAAELLYNGYRRDGIRSWWRGNSATMARIIPYAALQFTIHEELKRIMRTSKQQRVLPPGRRFLAGSLSGMSAVFLTYPLDMVRARLAVSSKEKYKSLPDAFLKIYQQEGSRTFYNGIVPTLLGIMPYAGISFFTYETLKSFYHDLRDNSDPSPIFRLLFGACAGLLGQSSSYPLDIVRRRMQTDGIDGKGYKYRKLFRTIKYVYSNEGLVKGFYKGLSINWVKGPIAVGISFTTFDLVQKLFQYIFHDDDI